MTAPTWVIQRPAKIRRMSKRRQKIALRYHAAVFQIPPALRDFSEAAQRVQEAFRAMSRALTVNLAAMAANIDRATAGLAAIKLKEPDHD